MPMVPEAVIYAAWQAPVVFGGFAANELAVRIDDATPKAIIAGSCGIEPARIVKYKPLLDEAIVLAYHKPKFCVIFQRKECEAELVQGRDYDWHKFQNKCDPCDPVPVRGSDPLYILYTPALRGKLFRTWCIWT